MTKKCPHCKKEVRAVDVRKYRSLKTGKTITYTNTIRKQKYCSRHCYHSFYKGKKQKGKRLLSTRKAQRRAVWLRKNDPIVRAKWLARMKEVQTGERNSVWIKDRRKVNRRRNIYSYRYKMWIRSVYVRDGFKCMVGDKNCKGRIEAHHIHPWRTHRNLRFQISNGITLCHLHHPRKRSEESRMAPFFHTLLK